MANGEKGRPIRTIELSGRGPNALSIPILRQVQAELEAAGGAPLLFVGKGRAFSAGLDLVELKTLDPAGIAEMLTLMSETVALLHRYPGPTAAAVNGHAIAGGCLVALTCDVRVATTNPEARFGMPALHMGIQYPPRVLDVLSARVPGPVLERLLLGADRFDAQELFRRGLVDELNETPVERAKELLQHRARIPAAAYRATKLDLGGRRARKSEGRFQEVVKSWTESDLPIMRGASTPKEQS